MEKIQLLGLLPHFFRNERHMILHDIRRMILDAILEMLFPVHR